MQMMNILKPIAFDVIHFMSQLFDYYLYAVYTFFGRNDTVGRKDIYFGVSEYTQNENTEEQSLLKTAPNIWFPKKWALPEWIWMQE